MFTKRARKLACLFLFLLLAFLAQSPAWSAGEHCGLKPRDQQVECYERVLDDIIRQSETQQALTSLQQWVASDPELQKQSHPLTHHIGRASYAKYHTLPEAFLHCTDAFASGCYHGVLEAHLSGMPHLVPGDVAEVCRGVKDPQRPAYTHKLCIHGLGHGLTMHFSNDMVKALTYCDGLQETFDRENCYGGVFMQNVMAYRWKREGGHHDHGGHGDHAVAAAPQKLLDPADHLYPCSVVADKYRPACYTMQSSAVLFLNGGNFAKTFTACQQAPSEYLRTCIASLGRDISGFTLTNAGATKAICSLAPPNQAGQCLRGAARDFIYTHADPQPGIALCRLADRPDKRDCYKGVREFLTDFYPDQEKRKQACRTADSGYRAFCWGAPWWMFWMK